MPLTDQDRMSLFGTIFAEYLEAGDNIDAIKEMQYTEEELAISVFGRVFSEVCNELMGLNSWISISEAELLFKTLLPHYGITNENIWWAVFNQDPTLHMWKQQQTLNDKLQQRRAMMNGDKKDFDRQMVIQSYISQFMIGTCELQFSTMIDRREYVFFEELKRLITLFAENKIKCSAEELKNNIMKVFPGLIKRSYLLTFIDKHFAVKLSNIKGEDFKIDHELEIFPELERPKGTETLQIKELAVEPAVEEKTIAAIKESPTPAPQMVPKIISLKLTPESIAAYLDSFMPQFNDLKELKDKAKEELAKIRKTYVTDSKKLRNFFMILGDLIKLYSPRYNYKKREDAQNQKIGQIYAAVNALHTAIGSDVATIIEHQQIIAKVH